ncbi:MAG: hypothetical protein ACXW25_09005 [Rhodospirillales bacterium]
MQAADVGEVLPAGALAIGDVFGAESLGPADQGVGAGVVAAVGEHVKRGARLMAQLAQLGVAPALPLGLLGAQQGGNVGVLLLALRRGQPRVAARFGQAFDGGVGVEAGVAQHLADGDAVVVRLLQLDRLGLADGAGPALAVDRVPGHLQGG